MPNAAPASVSMRYGFQGPAENTCTACAAGTHAIANAARLIAHGRCDVVLAGGSEAPFVRTAMAGFTNMTALSSAGISRPFDADRDGFVMGEGAGILLLEEWDIALERGATVLAEVLGRDELRDPAMQGVSVTISEVRVGPDLRRATAYVMPLGGVGTAEVVEALQRAAPFLRRMVAHSVDTRSVPALSFVADSSFDNADRIDALLRASATEPDQDEGRDGT